MEAPGQATDDSVARTRLQATSPAARSDTPFAVASDPDGEPPTSRLNRLRAVLRHFSFTSFQRIYYTRITVVLGFAAGFLLSHRLWISSRIYPLVPILHGLPAIKFPLDYICARILYLLLWMIALGSKPRPYILGFAALLIFLALYDQMRWQPWVYLYLFILLALSGFAGNKDDIAGKNNSLNSGRRAAPKGSTSKCRRAGSEECFAPLGSPPKPEAAGLSK